MATLCLKDACSEDLKLRLPQGTHIRCLLKDQEAGVLHLAVHFVDLEAFIIRKLSGSEDKQKMQSKT